MLTLFLFYFLIFLFEYKADNTMLTLYTMQYLRHCYSAHELRYTLPTILLVTLLTILLITLPTILLIILRYLQYSY